MAGIGAVTSGITSAMGLIQTLDSAFNTVQSFGADPEEEYRKQLRSQQDLALSQLKARQAADETYLAEQTALEREQLALDAEQAEEDRIRALKRAMARQRANFAGQGISSAGGSAEAVLLGLFEESEEEKEARDRLDALRSASLDLSLSQNQGLNVLQRTQLEEKQQLTREIEGF